MNVKLIGLGKMGYNLALNMKDNNIDVVGYDVNESILEKAKADGIEVTSNLDTLLDDKDNIVWVMLPAGKITNLVLDDLKTKLSNGDIVIDGGNSDYIDSLRHSEEFKAIGVNFMDVGTSGGVNGARYGASFSAGGDRQTWDKLEHSLFAPISAPEGYLYTGVSGSGHYLKMIHNGILYGYMQTLGEGFELLEASEFDYDLKDVAGAWNKSAVIRGWLLELAENAFEKDSKLERIKGEVSASDEARRTLNAAINYGVPTPSIALALTMRLRSKQDDSFAAKVIASLRNEVGGHVGIQHIEMGLWRIS